MARHPRLIFPGVALHVIQRGNNRKACFAGDSDYLSYLAHLRHLSGKYRCELHAYCLMTNHVHLLLTPQESEACSLLMRDLGRSYVRYFNRRHDRTGSRHAR
jgi:putative transposase